MIEKKLTLTRGKKMVSDVSAGLVKQVKQKEYARYRNIRACFLQQSASYLGADLRDSRVLSLCYGDFALDARQFIE